MKTVSYEGLTTPTTVLETDEDVSALKAVMALSSKELILHVSGLGAFVCIAKMAASKAGLAEKANVIG